MVFPILRSFFEWANKSKLGLDLDCLPDLKVLDAVLRRVYYRFLPMMCGPTPSSSTELDCQSRADWSDMHTVGSRHMYYISLL